jgi:cytochrome P450
MLSEQVLVVFFKTRTAYSCPVVLGSKNIWSKHARKFHLCLCNGISLIPIAGYAMAKPYDTTGSLLTTINPAEHRKRRRIWDRAFTPAAIKSYEPLLEAPIIQLVEQPEGFLGKPLDLAE